MSRSRDYDGHGPLGLAIPAIGDRCEGWTGPVLRLRELTLEERRALGDSTVDARPHQHETWRCPSCRNWTMDGAHLRDRCNWCNTSRPPYGVDPWS